MAPGDVSLWLAGFSDRPFIGSPHDANVAAAVRVGILGGQADGRFYPFFPLTRAQAVGILHRAFYLPLSMRAIHGGYTANVYPSSHGCVRIHNWDADGIYSQLPVGRSVDVYY